jgi:hypothetical protein
MLFGPQAQQTHAKQRAALQVEGLLGLCEGQLMNPRVLLVGWHVAPIDQR